MWYEAAILTGDAVGLHDRVGCGLRALAVRGARLRIDVNELLPGLRAAIDPTLIHQSDVIVYDTQPPTGIDIDLANGDLGAVGDRRHARRAVDASAA